MAGPDDDNEQGGVAEWVVTYGDMMSLLLTFFIMLVSLSEVRSDEGEMRAMLNAIRQAFGPAAGDFGTPGRSTQENSNLGEMRSLGVRSEGGAKKAGRTSPGRAGPHRAVERINHGTVVTLGGPTLFRPFDASLTDAMKANLETIADVVTDQPQRLMIRGHSSPEPPPPDSPFAAQLAGILGGEAAAEDFDVFDLSFARAHAVAEYLIEQGIDRRRIVVSAAGDAEPRISTRSRDRRRLNRRVDVFLIDSYITPAAPPSETPDR